MQKVQSDFKGPVRKVVAEDSAHTPSWDASSKGIARITLEKHERGGWLSIKVLETSRPDQWKRRGSLKEVMVTLDASAAEDLYYALRRMFEMVKCSRCGERPSSLNGMVKGPTGTPGHGLCEACMEV